LTERDVNPEDRAKEIVRLVDEERVTQVAIGKWFGISKQRVNQIYKTTKKSEDV
tara:strand:- start:237 stop:398 length:162 start_codon:yes stop_codon:yes gene_type:complete